MSAKVAAQGGGGREVAARFSAEWRAKKNEKFSAVRGRESVRLPSL
jgi:hypothetical protein